MIVTSSATWDIARFGSEVFRPSPRQAKELGIHQEEKIKVLSRRGEIEIKADLSERMERDIIFIPFHFVESAANMLTNPAFDPIAKIPEFKVCAVKIEKMNH
jgi:anaerobic selenocysteine-containing dehydrogenase